MGLSRADCKRLGIAHLFEEGAKGVVATRLPKLPPAPYEPWPRRWVVAIPGWRPTLASELKCHPQVAARKKKRDLRIFRSAAVIHGVLPAFTRRRVSLEIAGRYSTYPDDDAPWKSLLDALKQSGAIVDDSREWCEADYPPRYSRGPDKLTIVTLADIIPMEKR